LKWADLHHEETGEWPKADSSVIASAPIETWSAVESALRNERRGLPGGSSLAQVLAEWRGVRNIHDLPDLSAPIILGWADAYHQRTGCWPTQNSGAITEAPTEKWMAVDGYLRDGSRGLVGGSSIAKLLAQYRGHRNLSDLPNLTIEQILEWADDHFEKTGKWPLRKTGPIVSAPSESWQVVDTALRGGLRGLPGGSSLAQSLDTHRGARNIKALPPLNTKVILIWSDGHYRRTGKWPTRQSGIVVESPLETWQSINQVLVKGLRGLTAGISLAQLLEKHRGVRNRKNLQPLCTQQILNWADDHHRQTGEWPKRTSGKVFMATFETWSGIEAALQGGIRGLTRGSTLAGLLATHRSVPNRKDRPRLTVKQILSWAKLHKQRTGYWPTRRSGQIEEALGDTWNAVDTALAAGIRGLPGGSSLPRLLKDFSLAKNRKT
jgi:hypothetical protein